MKFAVGSLVKARNREWVVLPDSAKDEQMLIVRPLGGTNEEVTGIYLPLESVEPAQFDLPEPKRWGDDRSGQLLRDAVRLGFRASSGPFRSFAGIAVEPRPYQLVPLLMALRLDPVRLLIADDVGIGKTVEAGLILRELLDRREIERFAILCPPHLAEQWQSELREKFHIEAVTVLSSTAAQLERRCVRDESIFQHYPHLIISIDFIKADRRRDQFLRTCPELVIVDEAHTCASAAEGRGARHQRYQLIRSLADDPKRHLILVTATPHSGNEEAFRSLLHLLSEEFKDLPEDLSGRQNERNRQRLATQFIQRRRVDLRSYLQSDTPFPERVEGEASYTLSPEYRQLVDKVMSYAREMVQDTSGGRSRQRVRWWSVLALLRSIASSPAAAAFTLRNRSQVVGVENVDALEQIGRHTVMDLGDSDATEGQDVAPGADIDEDDAPDERKVRNRLAAMAHEAEELKGAKDAKLQTALKLVADLVKEGYQPIVFCRFIPTAEYVAQELRKHLKQVDVAAVTGLLPPVEREERIERLTQSEKRVLVCTDCLSEGINLQDGFNAVLHYDLSWNPTRHEQREGRVDRFGQVHPQVKVITYYGQNNIIDGIVLDVLLRKHSKIRRDLGISVPVPVDTEQVVEAIFEGVIERGYAGDQSTQATLPGFDDVVTVQREALFQQWDASSEREKRTRTIFAQSSIKTDEVEKELQAVQSAIGQASDVATFTKEALRRYGAFVNESPRGDLVEFDLRETLPAVRDAVDLLRLAGGNMQNKKFRASFSRVGLDNAHYLSRTHPLVEGLAAYVMDTALDSQEDPDNRPLARRCGVIKTSKVQIRTTLLLARLRFHILAPARAGREPQALLAEECRLFAFRGSAQNAEWFEDEQEIEALLQARAEANLPALQIEHFLRQVTDNFSAQLGPRLAELARIRANELRESHWRVRKTAHLSVKDLSVEPQLPPDVLGLYVYLPK
jgi:superfamily II DNA or RNA helicase